VKIVQNLELSAAVPVETNSATICSHLKDRCLILLQVQKVKLFNNQVGVIILH